MRGGPGEPPGNRRMVEIAQLQLAAGCHHIALVDAEAEGGSKQDPGEECREHENRDASRRRLQPRGGSPVAWLRMWNGIYLRRKYSSYGVSFLTSTPPST